MSAQSAEAEEFTNSISLEGLVLPKGFPGYDIKKSDNETDLRNVEYHIIAITPRSTLTRSGST